METIPLLKKLVEAVWGNSMIIASNIAWAHDKSVSNLKVTKECFSILEAVFKELSYEKTKNLLFILFPAVTTPWEIPFG